jgi:hypothetical protein
VRAEGRLIARAVNDPRDRLFIGRAASTLLEIGRIEGAARILASLVEDAQDRAQSLADIHDCVVISSVQGFADVSRSHVRSKELASWWNDPEAASEIAEWASQVGLRGEALWSARRALADEKATADDIQSAGQVLLATGDTFVDEVIHALYSRPPRYAVNLISGIREAGKLEDAYNLAIRALEGPLMEEFTIRRLAEAWIACDEWSVNDLVRRVKGSRHSGPEYIAMLASVLAKTGGAAEVSALVQCFLKDSRADKWDFGMATDALLMTKGERVLDEILTLCVNAPPDHVFAAIGKLCDHEKLSTAVELIDDLTLAIFV